MKLELTDSELEMVCGGCVKPGDCGGSVDQYDVKPGHVYYLHYDAGGHDDWLKVYVLDTYEKTVSSFLWIDFTKRTAKIRLLDTGLETETPINEPGCICTVKGETYHMVA